jgi:hypothetical protein
VRAGNIARGRKRIPDHLWALFMRDEARRIAINIAKLPG